MALQYADLPFITPPSSSYSPSANLVTSNMRLSSSIIAKLAVAASLVAGAPPGRRQITTPDVTVIPDIAPPVVIKDYELVIDNSAVGPDGFWRSSTVAGLPGQPGTFPGPPITANRGESLRIKVRNELVDPTMRRSTSIVRMDFQSVLILADISIFVAGCSHKIALVRIRFSLPHRSFVLRLFADHPPVFL